MSVRARKIVGVIGLGIIGQRVADNLRQRGFRVFVWNRTPRPVPNFVGSPAEVVELCHSIQIFVSDDEALLEMVQRISRDLGPDHLIMAHCTVSPDTMRAAAEIVARRGARFLDAPFTGSKSAAEAGQLVYYVGGDEAALQQARPILEASSKEVIEIGQVGDATTIKVATNMVTAATVQGAAEALALVAKSGLPPDTFARAMRSNGSYSGTLEMKLPMMLDGNYEAHFSVKHMLKDVAIATRLARFFDIEVAATDASRRGLLAEMQKGRGDDDYSSLFRQYFPNGFSPKSADQAENGEEAQPRFEGIDEQITVEPKQTEQPPETDISEVTDVGPAERTPVPDLPEKAHENGSVPVETRALAIVKEHLLIRSAAETDAQTASSVRSAAPEKDVEVASSARSEIPKTEAEITSSGQSESPEKDVETKVASPAHSEASETETKVASSAGSASSEADSKKVSIRSKPARAERSAGRNVGKFLAPPNKGLGPFAFLRMAQPFDLANPTFFDLSSRVKLRVTGADAFRFLNGQISNDLRKANRDTAIQASVLSVKGKLNALIFVSAEADSFLIDSDPEVTDDLPARLERYIIADDVQVENVTDRFGIFHFVGQEPLPSRGKVIEVNRFGCQGHDIWFDRAAYDELFQQLSVIATFCDEECTELGRIERGIPRWGHELTGEIIPIEANLEETSIDYAKGCYIGQEIISRMRSSGQTNKRLSGLISLSGAPLHSGMRLTTNDEEGREVGWITSATHSQRLDRQIALGYLKRGHTAHGAQYRANSIDQLGVTSSVPVEVVNLPFPEAKNG